MLRKPLSDKNYYPLVLIVITALILRFIGIDHSFPYILHPDEPAVERAALGLRFDLNPGHFDWPHLFIYLNFGLYKIFAFIRDLLVTAGLKESISSSLPILWDDNLIYYLISRIFAATLGAFTAVPVFLSADKLFGRKAAILSALAMALLPYHVRHSHYALIDVPMTFFLSWAIYFCTKIFYSDETKNYLFAGLFVGLAASTKYNGGLIAIVVPLAFFLSSLYLKIKLYKIKGILNLLASGLAAVVGFIIGTPYSVLDFETFTRTDGPKGALWQFTNVGKVTITEQFNQFVSALSVDLPDDFGYVFMAVYLVVIFAMLFKLFSKNFSKDDLKVWLLIIPSILFFFYVSGFSKNRTHYYMITYPFVVIIFGYAVTQIEKYLGSLKKLVLFLMLTIPLYFSIQHIRDLMETPEITPETKIYGGKFERR